MGRLTFLMYARWMRLAYWLLQLYNKKSVTNREQKMTKYEMILSVYHTHSISVTAEKYNYTQSAISQAIKSFEKELGLPLFKRTKNGMLPISNTEEIIRELRTICDAENRIADIASNLTSLKNGYIHIGTIKSIAYNWLPSMVKNFSKKYPNIHFKISMGSSSQLHDKLDQNEVDCIFVSNYLLPDNLEFYPMDTDELMLLTARNHPLADKLKVNLTDIKDENYIYSEDGFDFEAGGIFEQNDIHPTVLYQLDDDVAVQKMVSDGMGISVLPKLLLSNPPFDICIRPFTEHYKRTLGVAYLKDSELDPATEAFLEYVKEWKSNKGEQRR